MNEFSLGLGSSFALILAAEFADKSQLVCISLASRYKIAPVLLGAAAAFILLNILAVSLGTLIIQWVPEILITTVAGILFIVFGIYALFSNDAEEAVEQPKYGSIFISSFLLIFVAELGDKTQLSVIALATEFSSWSVFIGASLALLITSGLGVLLGSKIIQWVSISTLHRISGSLFIVFGLYFFFQVFILLT